MEIKTKFKLNDFVYVIYGNELIKRCIDKIKIIITEDILHIIYLVNGMWYPENNIFSTKEDLLFHIKEKLKTL